MQTKLPLVETSEDIASCSYPGMNKGRRGRNIYIWSGFFLEFHRLPDTNQGRHVKVKSIISDENTQNIFVSGFDPKDAMQYLGIYFSE